MWLEWTLVIGAVWVGHWVLWRGFFSASRRRYPPSFYGFPLVGVFPFIVWDRDHVELAKRVADTHGPVFRFRMGLSNVVMVNGGTAVKEALKNNDLLGRPPLPVLDLLYRLLGGKVLISMEGYKWRVIRNFSVHSLRDLGFGKTPLMESKITDEISFFLHDLSLSQSAAHNPRESLLASVSNNIATLIFGDRLPYNHPKRRDLNLFLMTFIKSVGYLFTFSLLPVLQDIMDFFGVRLIRELRSAAKRAGAIFDDELNEHLKMHQPGEARDFMDQLIEKSSTDSLFDQAVIRGSCVSFFGAGSNTSRIVLEYLLQLAAAYPHLQESMYQEIIREVGDSRLPCWADKDNLHMVNAFIQERHRIFSVVPFGVFRRATCDTTVCGFDVPKGSVIIYNLHSVHCDPTLFDQPEDFNPARFLDSNGKFVASNNVIPFAIGKRACPGETFAVFEIFLYFAAILQRYRITPGVGGTVQLNRCKQFFSEPISQPLRFINRVSPATEHLQTT